MATVITTPWSTPAPAIQPMTDADRHNLFSAYVKKVANLEMPWLFPLLDAAGATVFALPGVFLFSEPSNPNYWHSISEMASFVALTPWAEENAQPQ